MIDSALILNSLPALLRSALISLHITLAALCIGIIGGTILGIIQTKGHKVLQWLVTVYVGLIRGTPMLIHITFFYYVLPQCGIMFSGITTAILAIGINSSAYVSQIIRSGINAVGKEQSDAARVLGFTRWQTISTIILPQAIKTVVPALANEGVTLMKDSSLASIIGVNELYKESRAIINQTYDIITIFVIVALLYLLMTSALAGIAYLIERKMNHVGN